MVSETIQGTQLGQFAQFVFRHRNPPAKIFQRIKWPLAAFSLDGFTMFLPEAAYHAKAEAKGVVRNNGASPIRLLDADRLNLHAMTLCIFDDRCRSIKTHRLVVEQTGVK